MCGILGVYGNGEVSYEYAKNGINYIAHRGPDNSDLYIDKKKSIILGHTRLAIIDTDDAANQPMISSNGKVVIVFNGEIYNHVELRSNLERKGFCFKTKSDTEVLLNLYVSEGVDMLHQLNGIFSFSIWDSDKEELFIVRDGFGVKPLYYSFTNNSFYFSSEIKSLLCLDQRKKQLDLNSISRYLAFLWCPGEGSPLKNIKKLSPGEYIVVKKGKVYRKCKWYNLPATKTNHLNVYSKKNSIKGVESRLKQAVHRQMMSDVPVGAFLSGGLDSSSVVAFAREVNPDINCFTIDSGRYGCHDNKSDLKYAKKVAKHLNVPLDIITVESDMMASGLENMIAMLDEPLADPAALNIFYISKLAQERGIKVLLSGVGGDDIFTGYRRHQALQVDKWLLQFLPYKVRSAVEDNIKSKHFSSLFFRRLAKLFSGSTLGVDDRIVNYFYWADKDLIQSLFTKEAYNEMKSEDISAPINNFISQLSNKSALEKMLIIDQRFFLSDHNLIYTDKMSMAFGIETRVPFLDRDLVEFSANIPMKYKQRMGTGKWVLKKAMEPYLPHDVIYRKKVGFGVPLRHWLKFELNELLLDLLSEESLNCRGIFNPVKVHKLIKDNEDGLIDATYTIFSLMCIEIWCRIFLDDQFEYRKIYKGVG
jgi:asparagine synthase (glutamine-hydrolysing)